MWSHFPRAHVTHHARAARNFPVRAVVRPVNLVNPCHFPTLRVCLILFWASLSNWTVFTARYELNAAASVYIACLSLSASSLIWSAAQLHPLHSTDLIQLSKLCDLTLTSNKLSAARISIRYCQHSDVLIFISIFIRLMSEGRAGEAWELSSKVIMLSSPPPPH